MTRISTTLDFIDVEGEFAVIEGVVLTCDKCGHSEESAGTGDNSVLRCAHLLRENCPRREKNFYIVPD